MGKTEQVKKREKMNKAHHSWIEVDADAITHNVKQLKQFFGKKPGIVGIIKGNAYGHGDKEIARILERAGLKNLGVFSADEAMRVKKELKTTTRLQIMGYVHPKQVAWVVKNDCEPWIGTEEAWERFKKETEKQKKKIKFHVEIDTGMNRTGLTQEAGLKVIKEVQKHPYAVLEGVCSHFAGNSWSYSGNPRNDEQKKIFNAFIKKLKKEKIKPKNIHISSSSEAIIDPKCRHDLVRMGIALYGFWLNNEIYHKHVMHYKGKKLDLRRALTWKTNVLTVKKVKDQEYVGYGNTYQAEGNQKIAVIPVGYSDGFSRELSNQGHVIINGRKASIIGLVNMNMLQAHVTHTPKISEGDEVVLIGTQGEEEISVKSFAEYNSIVNYELMTRLSKRIPRITLYKGAKEKEPIPPNKLST